MANNVIDVTLTVYKLAVKTPKLMFYQPQKTTGPTQRSLKPVSCPQMTVKVRNSHPHIPSGMGTPSFECGQKGHIKPQCPKLKGIE